MTIPWSVTSISHGAFSKCYALKSVQVSRGHAWVTCFPDSQLTNVVFGSSVKSIPERTLRGYGSLVSVTIPDSVTSIGVDAFSNCQELASVTIGKGVTSIAAGAFSGCPRLGDGVVICDGWVVGVSGECPDEVWLPDGVYGIADSAFSGRTNITKLVASDSLAIIGSKAFYGCTNLVSAELGDNVVAIGVDAFRGCQFLGEGFVVRNGWVLSCATDVDKVVLPEGTRGIAESVFLGCTNLVSVVIPEGVKSIPSSLFRVAASWLPFQYPKASSRSERQPLRVAVVLHR